MLRRIISSLIVFAKVDFSPVRWESLVTKVILKITSVGLLHDTSNFPDCGRLVSVVIYLHSLEYKIIVWHTVSFSLMNSYDIQSVKQIVIENNEEITFLSWGD